MASQEGLLKVCVGRGFVRSEIGKGCRFKESTMGTARGPPFSVPQTEVGLERTCLLRGSVTPHDQAPSSGRRTEVMVHLCPPGLQPCPCPGLLPPAPPAGRSTDMLTPHCPWRQVRQQAGRGPCPWISRDQGLPCEPDRSLLDSYVREKCITVPTATSTGPFCHSSFTFTNTRSTSDSDYYKHQDSGNALPGGRLTHTAFEEWKPQV